MTTVPVHATGDELRAHEVELIRDRDVWARLLLSSRTLLPSARLVGLVVALYSDEGGKAPAWCSLTDLANATGHTVNQVRYALDVLQREHWLERAAAVSGYGVLHVCERPLFLAWPPEPGQ